MDQFIDPGFQYHRAMAQLHAGIALTLAESPVLPFNLTAYSSVLLGALKVFRENAHLFGMKFLQRDPAPQLMGKCNGNYAVKVWKPIIL